MRRFLLPLVPLARLASRSITRKADIAELSERHGRDVEWERVLECRAQRAQLPVRAPRLRDAEARSHR